MTKTQPLPTDALPDERAAFEARFPVPGGVSWSGSGYVVEDDYINSYRCDRFIGQWAAWQARAVFAKWGTTAPVGVEPAEFSQFLSDVMTAAGLVTHGKQCKDLGVRLGDMCSRLRADQVLDMGRVPLTRQQLREAFYNDTACTLGGDVDLAEKVCRVVEKAHGIKQGGQHVTE